MKAFYFVLSVAVLAVSANAGVVIQEEHPIDWYDCSGEADGNYVHPMIVPGLSVVQENASQRDCANCDIDPVRCPDGRLVYDPSVDRCEWADTTTCSASPRPSTEPPTQRPTEQTSTEGPIPTPSSESPSTAEPTTNNPTTTTEPSTGLPEVGTPCNPDACLNHGDCHTFVRCSNESGSWVWVEKDCGPDLIWNPHNSDGSNHIHGGNCDFYDKLQESQKEKYRQDDKCLKCYWKAFGKCSRVYEYQEADLKYRAPQNLTCSDKLVFVEELETCQRCEKVIGENGRSCC
ncbi:hypothetical protein Ocin01_18509 [Orchesella cincta]|uniref:Chitin-binding type-2 domain-containing protein n=1 Tax=Orchesella cincta TaxID=48709 RepID=A0A1D2M5C5_ORCCI|nr:hypothetical protein Ocin01_18509 [Orchesella cincta]